MTGIKKARGAARPHRGAWADSKLLPAIKRAIADCGVVAVAKAVGIGLPALRVYVNGGGKTGIVRPGTRALIERFADDYTLPRKSTGGAKRTARKASRKNAGPRPRKAPTPPRKSPAPPALPEPLSQIEKPPGDTSSTAEGS